jgi:uncharacterized protein involved in exopolysaccharide biosynthesis
MSEPTYSDPAASPGGGVRLSPDDPTAKPAASAAGSSVISKIVARWWLIATCLVIALLGAFGYLVLAAKVYTGQCVISAELPPGVAGATAGNVAPADFLYQQRDFIKSPAVVSAAATTAIKSDAQVRNATDVSVSESEGVLTIRYDAARPDDAARGANAVAEAYLRLRGQQQGAATAGLSDLARQRDQLTTDRAAKEAELKKLRETTLATGTDAERVAASRLEQLQQAITAAQVEATTAAAALNASKELLADPQKLRNIIEANRGKGIFDRLEAQRTATESELRQLEPQLEKQKQSMLPQHPVVLATQRKIDSLKARLAELDKEYGGVYLAHLEQQRATAQKRVDELKRLVDEQASQAKDYSARAARVAEAETELKKVDAAMAAVDGKIRDATVSSGASAVPMVKIVVPAQPPTRASRPDAAATVMTAAAAGLVAGLLLAGILPRATDASRAATPIAS